MIKNKPKLWFTAPRFCGVSEVWMYRQANGLRGFDVHVASKRIENQDRFPPENFSVMKFPVYPDDWSTNRWLRYRNYLQNFNRDFFMGSVKHSQWLDQQFTQPGKPDLVFCHYGTHLHLVAKHAIRHGIPVVAHFNGYDLSQNIAPNNKPANFADARYPKQLRKFGPKLRGAVVVADYMVEALKKFGVPSDRIQKIAYGVSCAEFQPSTGLQRTPCRFLTVGNFVEKKRPDLTIRAFAICHKAVPDSELVMIGDGELMARCRKIVDEEGIGDKVHFLGRQFQDRVKEELGQASVFLQHSVTSSRGDKEGWPVAIGEAAASGLPIVSTNHASIPEQVDDGVTGFIVNEHDYQAMGEAMARLAASPEMRQRFGDASRSKAMTYELELQLEKLDTFLGDCLK